LWVRLLPGAPDKMPEWWNW